MTERRSGLCGTLEGFWARACQQPTLCPQLRKASSQWAVLSSLLPIYKASGGSSFEKQNIPQFCSLKSFPQSTMMDSFAQKYKGKGNPLKDLGDFSIRFNFTLKKPQEIELCFL